MSHTRAGFGEGAIWLGTMVEWRSLRILCRRSTPSLDEDAERGAVGAWWQGASERDPGDVAGRTGDEARASAARGRAAEAATETTGTGHAVDEVEVGHCVE